MEQSSTNTRHFVIAGVLVFVSTVVVYLLLDWALPLPEQASTQAINIDRLFNGHVLLIAFLFSLIVVFMCYALVVFRRREGDEGEGEHFEGNTRLEIAWTSAPMIFVIIFSVWGVLSLNEVTKAEEGETTVKIVAQQWNFLFYYGDDEHEAMEIGGTPREELVVLVDQPAVMKMRSNDVLHAFWVPAFRVKQDIIPNGPVLPPQGEEGHGDEEHGDEEDSAHEPEPDFPTLVRFTPNKVGNYRLRCAELCGGTHYNMRAYVYVVEEAEYNEFLDGGDIVCIVNDVENPAHARRCS